MEGYPNSEDIHAAQIAQRRTPLLSAADEWQVGSIVEGAYGHTLRCQLVRSKGPHRWCEPPTDTARADSVASAYQSNLVAGGDAS